MPEALETKPVAVYNIATPEPQKGTLAPHEVQEAVQSGQYSLPKGEQVNVLNPDGDLGTIDAKEAPEAFQNGYRYATPDMVNNVRFGSGVEQVKAGLEGLAEGVAGPIAPAFERAFGVKSENIRARAEANPISNTAGKIAGFAGSLMSGVGEGALLDQAGNAAVHGLGVESSVAKGAVKAATEMALMSSGDEVSKVILQDPNQSVESAITNIGLSGLLGASGGAALGAISPLAKAASESKLGSYVSEMKNSILDHAEKAESLIAPQTKQVFDPFTKTLLDKTIQVGTDAPLAGLDPFTKKPIESVASATEGAVKDALSAASEKPSAGARTINSLINKGLDKLTGKSVGGAFGAAAGSIVGHPALGAIIGEKALGPFLDSVLPSIIKPVLEKTFDSGAFRAAAEYGASIARGQALVNKATGALFKPSAEVVAPRLLADDKSRDKLDKKLDEFSQHPERLADVGGQSTYYMPHHAIPIGETAGRVVSYLNSIKPRVQKQAPLDPELKPSKPEVAEYHKALDLAEQPLSIVKDIKDGTIRPQDVDHLKAMYPTLYQKIATNIHEEIMNHVVEGNQVPYQMRLGLSLFLGEPLDASITQPQIMAAQMTFNQTPTPQQGQAPRGGKIPTSSFSALNKASNMYQTPQQARVADKSTV